jgi:hypothetical protein
MLNIVRLTVIGLAKRARSASMGAAWNILHGRNGEDLLVSYLIGLDDAVNVIINFWNKFFLWRHSA